MKRESLQSRLLRVETTEQEIDKKRNCLKHPFQSPLVRAFSIYLDEYRIIAFPSTSESRLLLEAQLEEYNIVSSLSLVEAVARLVELLDTSEDTKDEYFDEWSRNQCEDLDESETAEIYDLLYVLLIEPFVGSSKTKRVP